MKTRVRDIEVYYEIHGSGPRLLFIGGSGGDLRQKPSLFDGPLAGHFEVLAYDQRGLGRTDVPDGPYTMADYGEDAAALLAMVGWDSCAVMGVSFGGMVAQELAVRHPAVVEKLVLACTSSGGAGKPSYPLHELQELPEQERAVKSIELSDTRCDAAWRDANPDALRGMIEFMKARASAGGADPNQEGFQRQLEARSHHDTWERISQLVMPVFICAGEHDGVAPPDNQHAMASQIPNAQLEFFGGGHLFLMQDKKAFPRIIEFLQA